MRHSKAQKQLDLASIHTARLLKAQEFAAGDYKSFHKALTTCSAEIGALEARLGSALQLVDPAAASSSSNNTSAGITGLLSISDQQAALGSDDDIPLPSNAFYLALVPDIPLPLVAVASATSSNQAGVAVIMAPVGLRPESQAMSPLLSAGPSASAVAASSMAAAGMIASAVAVGAADETNPFTSGTTQLRSPSGGGGSATEQS